MVDTLEDEAEHAVHYDDEFQDKIMQLLSAESLMPVNLVGNATNDTTFVTESARATTSGGWILMALGCLRGTAAPK